MVAEKCRVACLARRFRIFSPASIKIFAILLLYCWFMWNITLFINTTSNLTIFRRQLEEVPPSRLWDLKFILLWRHQMRHSNLLTECSNCSASNCILTENRFLFGGDYSRYHAIVFDESHFKDKKWSPVKRSSSQIYIFTTQESSTYYPACELHNDDFFNWTFTYRVDSDVLWRFFVVRNISGDIVAPSSTVQWNVTKNPVPTKIKGLFRSRTRAAAWIVSHCNAESLRDQYLSRLQEHLFHYSLQIDVYGRCSKRKCDNNDCEKMLREKYYFYMAFENSFAEDYVTEKVLHGYNNFVVPIVYGGANYSRILPPGSYLNARELHPYNLAYIIHQAMEHADVYESYFHWTNSYTVDSDYSTHHPACDLCKAMNSDKVNYAPAKKNFRLWWNTLNGMKWCLSQAFWNEKIRIDPERA